MEKFLEELRKALEEAKVDNIEKILATYNEHFDLGHEAEMTDEDIIERFDSIEDIVNSFCKDPKDSKQSEYDNASDSKQGGYVIKLELAVFAEFEIKRKSENGIHFEYDEELEKYIEIERAPNYFKLSSKPLRNIGNIGNRGYDGILWIGKNIEIDEIYINNCAGDMEACSLQGNKCVIDNATGDLKFDSLNFSESIHLHNVSGEVHISSVLCTPELKIKTVNGDVKMKDLCCDKVYLDTVNGDINIDAINEATLKVNSVNGDIHIIKGDVKVESFSNVNGDIHVEGKRIEGTKISDVVSAALKSAFSKWK